MNFTKSADTSLLQRTYIQKSRIFLFPLTGIKKDRVFNPINTYVSSPDLIGDRYPYGIGETDRILIVNYEKKRKEYLDELAATAVKKPKFTEEQAKMWESFEYDFILNNTLFIAMHETDDEIIYTFDMTDWKFDWDNFLRGRYSLLSQSAKDRIINYRWTSLRPEEKKKLMCYLYPNKEECLQTFAKQLNESVEDLRTVKELCSKPDLKLETFKCMPVPGRDKRLVKNKD